MSTMTLEHGLLASYLDDGGWHCEAENVRQGVDLESYEIELRLIDWLNRHTNLAQPAQAVDVGAVVRPCQEAAERAISNFLHGELGDVPGFTLAEDGEPSDGDKCGWSFWITEDGCENDTTSYVHADLSIEWYGTAWETSTVALSGEKAGPVDGWLPIETAPKDQTVLVYPPLWSGRTCSIARYNDDKYCKKPAPYWHRDDDLGQKTRSRGVPPTHWMPLPASPTPDKEGRDETD